MIAPKFGNVLVSSASSKVALLEAVRNSLRRVAPESKVIAGDSDSGVPASYVADDFVTMPRLDGISLGALLALLHERAISTVIPTRDGELQFWADNAELLAKEGIHAVVSPSASVKTCVDKLEFAAFGQRHGLPIIPAAPSPREIVADLYVVKERFGAGSRNIALRVRAEELERAARGLSTPVFQPFVGGQEISADAWTDRNHHVKGLVLRRRDRVVGGESVVTTTFRDDKVADRIVAVLEALRLKGPSVVQAMVNEDGVHIIECNARFGGASTAAIAAGLDSFFWTFSELNGADVDAFPFARIEEEIRQIRVQRDIHVARRRF